MPERKRTGRQGPSEEEMQRSTRIRQNEEILMDYLSPIESSVMTFQNLLVWENPRHSAVLFFIVHVLFWLATSVRIYYVIGLIGTIVVGVDMWKNHIWPEIRVPPSPGEDDEDWTPVHPRLLSVPEICHWLAQWSVYISDQVESALTLRRHNHPKFFFNAVLCLSCLAALGCYIPGILIAYLTVLFCLLWPCVLYHDGVRKLQEILQPTITRIEEKIKIRRKRKGKRKTKRRRGDKARPVSEDSDSDDLQEFMPKISAPEALLTQRLEESESEDDKQFKSGLLIPPAVPSRTPSREQSDAEDPMKASTDELGSLVSGLKDFPSYNDTLDGTGNSGNGSELSPKETAELGQAVEEAISEELVKQEVTLPGPSGEDINKEMIQFISSHFSQFSDEEDEALKGETQVEAPMEEIIEELSKNISSLPDAEDVATEQTAAQAMMASGLQLLTNQGQSLMSHGQALVSALGSTDISGLMASTMAGLSTIRDTVSTVVQQSAAGDDKDSAQDRQGKPLEAEFEFLSEADLNQAVLENLGSIDESN